ncbi:chemotaxis-specific methylesterase [Thioploca ingrica]|uniref:Protein-glutamate methylesterase/protein-glutamine glutaminase n=1 Tax=Thioploca ingrica TaxID=40754 RepID=A0A090BUC1_9GAMM|nr:chemotaxis-specific methylesterase [Thioploca ingrica]
MNKIIRVLVVDDSAYIRKVIKKILSRSPFIDVVGTACDGEEALKLVQELNPDVITLDLVMPLLDGIGFLRAQLLRQPLRVIIVSITTDSSEQVLEALDLGAIDFIHKPTSLATEKIFEISDELISKIKAAALLPLTSLRKVIPPPTITVPPLTKSILSKKMVDIVVLGISTGGPQALRFLIPQLPADFPVPIAMVLHMPVGYTKAYAEKLDEISALTVVEASEGEELRPGVALLAPAGRHLKLLRLENNQVIVHLDTNPSNTLHRPSVDVLFQSAAEIFHKRILGVVMTGMGSDGKQGAAWIKSQGGIIFTEAEGSCVVYGMPLSVVEAGLSDKMIPLERMSQEILEMV